MLFKSYAFDEFHVFLQRVSQRALARLGTSIGTICRGSSDKLWNTMAPGPISANTLPAIAANFWPIGGAAPVQGLGRNVSCTASDLALVIAGAAQAAIRRAKTLPSEAGFAYLPDTS